MVDAEAASTSTASCRPPTRAGVAAPGVEGSQVRCDRARRPRGAGQRRRRGLRCAAAREVRAHWRVLEAPRQQATVLPVRFGTVMEDERRCASSCWQPNAERLEALLDELAGRVQLSVKGDYDEQTRSCAEVVAASPAVARAARARATACPRRPATTSASASVSWSPPRSSAAASEDAARGARAARAARGRHARAEAPASARRRLQPRVPRRARARSTSFSRGGRRGSVEELGDRIACATSARCRPTASPTPSSPPEARDGPDHRTAHAAAGAGARAPSGSPRSSRSRPRPSLRRGRDPAGLLELEAARESGELDEEEIDAAEDALIERLMALRGYRGG